MKFNTVKSSIILTTLANLINADCQLSSDGNYYCSPTDAIIYSNVGISGSYNDITSMDESTCVCTSEPFKYSGSLAPFNEELSVHFRGPLNLKQFGVYYPTAGTSLKKRDNVELDNENCIETVSKNKHRHKRDVAIEYVEVTSTVYVNEDGEIVTSPSSATATTPPAIVSNANVDGTSTSSSAAAVASPAVGSDINVDRTSSSSTTTTTNANTNNAASSASNLETTPSTTSIVTSPGGWNRLAYYTPGSTTNCTFMNHMGGTAGSGVWSSCFGNSISFAAANGVDGASSPCALDDVTVKSGQEYIIFSGVECSGENGDCGYYREGIPAYHGFGGSSRIFVFEFEMPSDTVGTAYNQDMPAIWLLNAKIPRTLQYGKADCSCWESGCGEMDLFEILSPGSDKLISHVHDTQGGGTQDYFVRPVGNTMKAAVVFDADDRTVHIVEVEDTFEATLSESTVNSWLSKAGSAAILP